MQLHAIPMPKPIRIATPKIAAVKVSRIPTGGLKVQHVMHQAPTTTLVVENERVAGTGPQRSPGDYAGSEPRPHFIKSLSPSASAPPSLRPRQGAGIPRREAVCHRTQ